MAHNVTERDGMFAVRHAAWWDLDGSHVLPDYPTRAQAQAIAHPWEPEGTEVYVRQISPTGDIGFLEAHGYTGVLRSDTKALIGIVSEKYTPVLNSTMYDIAEALENHAPGSVQYETGGSLKGGAKVWLLMRLKEPLIVKGDPNGAVIPYYALQNAHDGSGAFRGQSTMTRIVCDNTAIAADLDARARGTEFVFRHTVSIKDRIEQAKIALRGWRSSIEDWQLISEHLIGLQVSPEQREGFVLQFIPEPPPALASERVMLNVEAARDELRYILTNSPTTDGIGHTAYGLVQASIEYAQHYRKAMSNESRFRRAYLDRSHIAAHAARLAREAAKA